MTRRNIEPQRPRLRRIGFQLDLDELDILDERTLIACNRFLKPIDKDRLSLFTFAFETRGWPGVQVQKILEGSGLPVLDRHQALRVRAAVSDLSRDSLQPDPRFHIFQFPTDRDDEIEFMVCPGLETRVKRREHRADPILPFPKTDNAKTLVSQIYPPLAEVLDAGHEARGFLCPTDLRRREWFRRAGEGLAAIQDGIDSASLGQVDRASMLYWGRVSGFESVVDTLLDKDEMRKGYDSRRPRGIRALPGTIITRLLDTGR